MAKKTQTRHVDWKTITKTEKSESSRLEITASLSNDWSAKITCKETQHKIEAYVNYAITKPNGELVTRRNPRRFYNTNPDKTVLYKAAIYAEAIKKEIEKDPEAFLRKKRKQH